MTDNDINTIAEGIEEFIISGDEELRPIWGPYIEKLFQLKRDRPMAKLSQIDRVIANINKDIADLQAMKARLLLAEQVASPKRTRKPKKVFVAEPTNG